MSSETRQCVDVDSIPWELVPSTDGRVSMGVLRRFESGRVRSAVVRVGPGFCSSGPLRSTVDTRILYVLDGHLEVEDVSYGRGAMVGIRPSVAARLGSRYGATLVALVRPGPGACPGIPAPEDGPVVVEASDVPVVESIVGGKPTGIKRRVLWEDTDAGGDIRLLSVPPGFVGAGEGFHPCGEEIMCLDGSITADEPNIMTSGWYLYNPARLVHGSSERSERGAVLLEWHDGPWDLVRVGSK